MGGNGNVESHSRTSLMCITKLFQKDTVLTNVFNN